MRVNRFEDIQTYGDPGYCPMFYYSEGKRVEVDYQLKHAFFESTLIPFVLRTLRADAANIINSPPDWNRRGSVGSTWLEEGSLSEIPESVNILERFRTPRSNGKAWREAAKNLDLIVVSDYDIGEVEITTQPPSSDTSPGPLYKHSSFCLRDVFPTKNQPFSGFFYIGQYYVGIDSQIFSDMRRRYTRTFQLPEIPIMPHDLFQRCAYVHNEKLITGTLASADKACIDVLTTVAEMPETLRSVISGLRLIVKMVRDLRKGRLTLTSSFDKRKARIQRDFDRENARIANLVGNAKTKAQKKNLERRLKRLRETYSNALENSAKELVDALASIWMNFRYNIMPNVYTIEDAIKLMESYDADFITTRDKDASVSEIELLGWSPLSIEKRENCVIKRGINPNIRFTSLTHANFVTTAWELIPLSFVIDWFVNIGDVLTSSFSPNLAPTSGSTAGIKFLCEETIVNEFTGQKCHYRIKIYRRRVINPESIRTLVIQPELNLFRILDSLALLWNPIRDQLLSSKRK